MDNTSAQGEAVEASIEAVIIRADGTRVPLGVVSYWHKDPVKRALYALKKAVRLPGPVKGK